MKSIQWKLVIVYFLLLLFALELFGVYMLSSIENYYMTDLEENIHGQARLLAGLAERYFRDSPDQEGLQQLIREYSLLIGGEVYLLSSTGVVLASSPGVEEFIGRRLVQQEVISAIQGRSGNATRVDFETNQRHYYYAEPIASNDETVGVVYVSTPLQLIDSTLDQLRRILITGAVLTLAVSAILGLNLAGTITRPLRKITDQAEAMKEGDFSTKIDIKADDEIGRLSETFNALSDRLKESWAELVQEKDKVEGILANLTDGLIVLSHNDEVLHINSTACSWLGLERGKMEEQGMAVDLHWLTDDKGFIHLENGLILRQRRLPLLQAGQKHGTIIVLSDVTEQQRLDKMRQEFVANVSHELRTPLTSIKSYLEALIGNPDEDPKIKNRFLSVINAETDRMVRMVEDLLVLSRTEDTQSQAFDLQSIEEIIATLAKQVEVDLKNKRIDLQFKMSSHLPLVRGDRDQLYRLFLNIVNNSIKFTPAGGSITISAGSRKNYLEIAIADTGIGIPQQSLGRIFERFYRVEKARSRRGGGSGLGLAIAKQIAEIHGGNISISSQEGKGTEVVVTLPIAARQKLRVGRASKGGNADV